MIKSRHNGPLLHLASLETDTLHPHVARLFKASCRIVMNIAMNSIHHEAIETIIPLHVKQ